MIVLWIILIAAVYYIFKDRIHVDSGNRNESNAEEVLKKRYVNGDIDEETFLKMKKEIG